jgi:hypothetical protein
MTNNTITIRKRISDYVYEQKWTSDPDFAYIARWIGKEYTVGIYRGWFTSIGYIVGKLDIRILIQNDYVLILYDDCMVIANEKIRTLVSELIDNFNYTWEQIIDYGRKIIPEAIDCTIRDLKKTSK